MTRQDMLYNKLEASLFSGIVEVIATHPLDYAKTILQNNPNSKLKDYIKTPYKGVTSRLIGVVPMRILFWNSLDYFKNLGYNPILAGLYTSIIQTCVDFPIEQIKTQQINKNNYNLITSFKNSKIFPSYTSHLARNAGFAIIVNEIIQKNPDSLYYGAIGGFMGSLLTHPFDSLKTWYMSGNKNYPTHWTFKEYMKGWHYRCGVSLISMNIGWIVYHRLSNRKKN